MLAAGVWLVLLSLVTPSGIWTKDLKIQTNLAQPQLTKILKTLESSRLVKSIKGVAHPSRKLYILADIEPAREITGGAW
jgi:DNA-directed RNA polymerase III subunit RPC6